MPVRVDAGAETVHWGYFDAALAPIATIDSGDVVTIGTVSGPPEALPPSGFVIPSALYAVHQAKTRRMVPGHMCTGPVAVRGARPGQVLQVDIEAIDLAYDWGYVSHRPQAGALPHDFPERGLIHPTLDAKRMVGHLPWGVAPPVRMNDACMLSDTNGSKWRSGYAARNSRQARRSPRLGSARKQFQSSNTMTVPGCRKSSTNRRTGTVDR
jgi:hypothetical protein